ncbi:MAG: sigma 54-interacting transcriptional regulator [Bdellovibrionota bacterium]
MFEDQLHNLSDRLLSVVRASNEADSTLLITGNTGTGKSHLAYSVHRSNMRRSKARWFKVNLATLSENLIESELFGHERGAFTGADTRRTGKLEICNGGTVFLDEIGELSLRLQAKLLDFIQYKRISPVGSNREIELDVRIIAATNRSLEAAVKAGEFRRDLYHRLNVFHVQLPDLAMNPQTVLSLAREFLESRTQKVEKSIHGFSKEVEQVFRHYGWSGNIRELENTIEFAVAMEKSQVITLASLPFYIQDYARETVLKPKEHAPRDEEEPEFQTQFSLTGSAVGCLELPFTLDFHDSKDAFEKAYLEQVLRMCGGQINLTSRRIGLNKVSLTDKIKKYSIDWRRIRYESLGPGIKGAKAIAS